MSTHSKSRANEELDASLVKGVAWTSGVKWLTQVLSWAATLFVARLLTPEDYGLIGMSSVFIALVTIFSEFGLETAVVAKRELTRRQIAQLNTLSVLLGGTAFVVSCFAAGPLAAFFRTPELRWVVITMSLAFVIAAFRSVPSALLQRDLRFRTLAVLEGLQAFVTSASMVVLALLGFRYWTLVLGALLGNLFWTVLILLYRAHRFGVPEFSTLRDAITLSSHILGGRLMWYATSNVDFLMVGRLLGQRALGLYTIGWTLASMPVAKITAMVARVTPSIFSAVKHDLPEIRRYLIRLTEGLALITFPVAIGLALVAHQFLPLVLGEKWNPAVWPLRLLAVSAALRSIDPLLAQVLVITGHSASALRYGILVGITMPIAFFIGSDFGTAGVAAAWCLVYPIVMIPYYVRVFSAIQLSPRYYLGALWPATSGVVLMSIAVLTLELTILSTWPATVRLASEILAGALVYVGSIVLLYRSRLEPLREMVLTVSR